MNDLVFPDNKSAFAAFVGDDIPDLIAQLLADKRSENTRRAYAWDLEDFFLTVTGNKASPGLVQEFLLLPGDTAKKLALKYKSILIEKKLSESTVNRRLAAIRSLVDYARKIGKCSWTLQDIHGEKIKHYRDTTGIGKEEFRKVLAVAEVIELLTILKLLVIEFIFVKIGKVKTFITG